jgi:hypothetical protein
MVTAMAGPGSRLRLSAHPRDDWLVGVCSLALAVPSGLARQAVADMHVHMLVFSQQQLSRQQRLALPTLPNYCLAAPSCCIAAAHPSCVSALTWRLDRIAQPVPGCLTCQVATGCWVAAC